MFEPPPGAIYTPLKPTTSKPPPLFLCAPSSSSPPLLLPPACVFHLQHFSSFSSGKLCSAVGSCCSALCRGSAGGQGRVPFQESTSRTHAPPGPHRAPAATTSTLTLPPSPPFFPLYPCLTFTVFISLFSVSPFFLPLFFCLCLPLS